MVNAKTPNKVLIANPRACIGCRSCELVCSFYHYKEYNPARALIHVVKNEMQGIDIPVICQHCDAAPCVEVCPVGALEKSEESGAVLLDPEKCIGCRACVSACPFGAMKVDPKTGQTCKCDLCNGDPKCAKACKQGALLFVRKDVIPKILAHFQTTKIAKVLAKEMQTNEET